MTDSKRQSFTFRNFRGLDWRTTKMGVSPSAKPSEVGFEEMYAYIKQGVAHPLPAFSSLVSSDGRLFEA